MELINPSIVVQHEDYFSYITFFTISGIHTTCGTCKSFLKQQLRDWESKSFLCWIIRWYQVLGISSKQSFFYVLPTFFVRHLWGGFLMNTSKMKLICFQWRNCDQTGLLLRSLTLGNRQKNSVPVPASERYYHDFLVSSTDEVSWFSGMGKIGSRYSTGVCASRMHDFVHTYMEFWMCAWTESNYCWQECNRRPSQVMHLSKPSLKSLCPKDFVVHEKDSFPISWGSK